MHGLVAGLVDQVQFVDENDVGVFHLLDQQVGQVARGCVVAVHDVRRFEQCLKATAIDHRHQSIEPRQFA